MVWPGDIRWFLIKPSCLPSQLTDLQMIPMLLISGSMGGDDIKILTICITVLKMMSIEDDLHRLRPSNFHPPDGFIRQDHMTIFGPEMKNFSFQSSGSD